MTEPTTETDASIATDGGQPASETEQSVFENGSAENCPDCGGQLQYQNQCSIVCLGCGRDFEHWKISDTHKLYTADPGSSVTEIVATAPTGGDQR